MIVKIAMEGFEGVALLILDLALDMPPIDAMVLNMLCVKLTGQKMAKEVRFSH